MKFKPKNNYAKTISSNCFEEYNETSKIKDWFFRRGISAYS